MPRGKAYPKIPAGRNATVRSPSFPFACSTSSSALAFDSLYASKGFSGKGRRSSTSMTSWPLKTTPALLVKTSFLICNDTAAAITAFVPSTFTFQYIAGSRP